MCYGRGKTVEQEKEQLSGACGGGGGGQGKQVELQVLLCQGNFYVRCSNNGHVIIHLSELLECRSQRMNLNVHRGL